MEADREKLNLGRLFLNAFRWLDAGFCALMNEKGWPDVPKTNSLVFPHLLVGGIRPAEIARRAGVSRQAVHQVLADLKEMGLVELRADPLDRRAKLVFPTPLGLEFDRAVGDSAERVEKVLADRIGEDRVTALRESLEADWGRPLG